MIPAALVISGWLGWTVRDLWPPPGGWINDEGPVVAARVQEHADVSCIERWAAQVAETEPSVRGGSDVSDKSWPTCVVALKPMRVWVSESRDVELVMPGTWRLIVRNNGVRNTCWTVGPKSCVTYVER
jgi:hypothetical protein